MLLDDGLQEAEYNGRLEALMELLRARGSEPSSSAQRLFSVAGSQGQASQKARPDKGAGVGLADSPRGAGPARGAAQPAAPPMPAMTGPADALAAALDVQTKTLTEVLK
eukprot:11163126-Alexandrium_andersonii.AAC.1